MALVLPVIARLRIGWQRTRGGWCWSRVTERLPRRWLGVRYAYDPVAGGVLHPFGTFIAMRIVADYDGASIGVVSISGDIVALALKADPPCELEGGKQFAQQS